MPCVQNATFAREQVVLHAWLLILLELTVGDGAEAMGQLLAASSRRVRYLVDTTGLRLAQHLCPIADLLATICFLH